MILPQGGPHIKLEDKEKDNILISFRFVAAILNFKNVAC